MGGALRLVPARDKNVRFLESSKTRALIAESVRLREANKTLVAELQHTAAAIKDAAGAIDSRRKKKAIPNADENRLAKLTMREREMLTLIASSYSTKQIAYRMRISFKTAVCHRTHLMEKLDIHDVAGLTRFAIKNKIARV
jgi:DNA-binding NarL/FixJ family response regulator